MLAFVISFVVGFTVVTLYTVYKDFKEENKYFEQEISDMQKKKQKKDLNEVVDEGLQNLFQPLIDKAIEEVLLESVKGRNTYELDLRGVINSNDKDKYTLFKRQLEKALKEEYKNSFVFYARWNYTMMFIKWM
jgi:hypothetical protein|nr:MAG TPA: hypothetical protein [Caudoviricetes sp.]